MNAANSKLPDKKQPKIIHVSQQQFGTKIAIFGVKPHGGGIISVTMNREEQRGNDPVSNGVRIKRSCSPHRPNTCTSASPDRNKTLQANSERANIPDSEPKMVTLLKVLPRDASVLSRRQSRNKAALQEKKSQYLEYASQVEERRRQSKMMQGGRPVKYGSKDNISGTRNGPGKERTQSNPQLAHRPLSEQHQSRPGRHPPSKPQRHFSQSPPRQVTREPNKLPNGRPHLGPSPENHAHHSDDRGGHRISSSQHVAERQTSRETPKKRPKSLYPLPEPSHNSPVPRVLPRTPRSPNRRQQPSHGTQEPRTHLKIQAEVYRTPSSSDGTSPRHSLPIDSLPSEDSILSWFDKTEALDNVSNSYPLTGRSQSADPRSRGASSKVELRNDLKNFDEMSLSTKKSVRSPDARHNRSSILPEDRGRQSRSDDFAKGNRVPKASSHASVPQHPAAQTARSRIPTKKDNLRGAALKRQDAKHQTSSNPEPPPRHRNKTHQNQERVPEASRNSNSKIPSKGSKEIEAKSNLQHPNQTRRDKEPQAPPRLQKGSRKTPEQSRVRKSGESESASSQRNEKSSEGCLTNSVQPERPSSRHSVKTPVKTSKSPNEKVSSLDITPKRTKNTSPLNQELRRRLSEIIMESKNKETGVLNVRKKENLSPSKQGTSSEGGRRESPDQNRDVVDRMLDSTMEQDFRGELDKSLAQRKTKLEQSLENGDKGVSSVDEKEIPQSQSSQSGSKVNMMIENIGLRHDSGLGASYESQTNLLKDETINEKVLEAESSLGTGQKSPKETEIIVSEWSDEIDPVQSTSEEAAQAIKTESPIRPASASLSPPATSKSLLPSSPEDIPQDEMRKKVRLRRWSIASDGERPHVVPRPLPYSGEDKPESTKTSILSSMKVGISIPDPAMTSSDDFPDDRKSLLDDSNGLLDVKEIEEEIEKSSSVNTSSAQSTPCQFSPSQGSATPRGSSQSTYLQDLEEVSSSPRRKTPTHERLIQSAASQPTHHLERSHQSLRQLPVKVLPTSPQGENQTPTFSEDHDMSAMLLARPTTPSQPSKSPIDSSQKKARYLKLTGMQLLPQKMQLLGASDKSKGTSPTNRDAGDETDGLKQGLYKKSEYRGRGRTKTDFPLSKGPRVKKRSVSADGFFPFQRERSPSPSGLRGFVTPSRQGKLKDKRGRHKMLTPPGNHALKMPRQPRPQRMHTILDSLKKGLKDTIEVSKEKLTVMEQHQHDPHTTSSRQGFHYNLDKQIKVAERYIRKLQFHLAKVEEVHEQYDKELKVREGAVNVVKAYADTNLPHAKDPSSEAKASVRDCTQSLCQMEAELEANLGAFIVRIDGIAGFARVCRGDVFEVVFKYGLQKWKSRCKVEKDLSQTWDVDEIVMYPMLADFLTIKVTEMRGIARSNMVIGNLEFDTSDFYQADPQTLTIDVNENGTIKLNLVVTWSPFHVNEEMYRSPRNSYSRRERAFTESVISTSKSLNDSIKDPPKSPKKFLPKTLDLNTSPTLTLDEAMHNVTRLLEILKGQYTELDVLEKQVGQLSDLLKSIRDRKKRDSTMSLLVKNALESFDFLNDVDGDGGSCAIDSGSSSMDENRSSFTSDEFCKSQSSERLSDCASLEEPPLARRDSAPSPSSILSTPQPQNLPMTRANRSSRIINMSEKRESRLIEMNEQRERRLVDAPPSDLYGRCWEEGLENSPKMTTGSDSIDMVLVQHLMYIEYLLSHLGAFGPLKLKETVALQKLKQQAVIIEQLVVLAVSSTPITRADDVFPELKLNPELLEFWQHCAEKEALFVNAESFLLQLDVKFGAKLRRSHPDIADDVFQSLCNRIIERSVDLYHHKTIITLFQYIGFFATDDRRYPEKFISDLTKDFELTASLEPTNPDLLKVLKKLPKGSLLSIGNLRALGLLLLEDRATIQTGVRVYLESIGGDEKMRKKAVNVYLECLEERDLSLRQAGCAAIAALKANEALEQLLYLLRCDMDDVKSTAKEALMAFGEEGRQAYEQISYTPYGNYRHDYSEIDVPLMTTEL